MQIEKKVNAKLTPKGDIALNAQEFNQQSDELQNLITASGQTLNAADCGQLAKAVTAFAQAGQWCGCEYSFNEETQSETYTLTPITQMPLLNGALLRFKPAVINQTGSIKISVNGNLYELKGDSEQDIVSGDISNAKDAAIKFCAEDENGYFAIIQQNNSPAGAAGGKFLGEVFYSQSMYAEDNPGSVQGWNGYYSVNANVVFPDFYNWIKNDRPQLCVTKTVYEEELNKYGYCHYYVADSDGVIGSLKFPTYKTVSRVLDYDAQRTVVTAYNQTYTVEADGQINVWLAGPYKNGALLKINGVSVGIWGDDINGNNKWASASYRVKKGDIVELNSYGSNWFEDVKIYFVPEVSRAENEKSLYPWIYVFNAAVPESVAQASQFINQLDAKLNYDLSNLIPSDLAKTEILSWSMPGKKYDSLTLGANGSTYIAPAPGWLVLDKDATAPQANCIRNLTTKIGNQAASAGSYGNMATSCQANKGDVLEVTYNTVGALKFFGFVYAQGAI